MSAASAVVDALQDVLAGEHAALYAYQVIGARLDDDSSEVARAASAYDSHRDVRDAVAQRVRDLGEQPVVSEPGYALPGPVRDAPSAEALAQQVEDRSAVLHAALVSVAAASAPERTLGAAGLVAAATRGLAWGSPPTAFPGVSQP